MNRILSILIVSVVLLFFSSYKTFAATDLTNSWITLQNLPYSIASHGSVSHNGEIYIIAGATTDDTSSVSRATQNNNGDLSSWASGTNVPDTRFWATTLKRNDDVYVIGGARFESGITTYVNTIYRSKIQLDNSLSSWNLTSSLPNNLSQGGAVTVGNWIYFMGGRNSSGIKSEIYYAPINPDGTIGSWSTSSIPLPSARHSFGITSYNNHIIIVGGVIGSVTSKVFKTTVNSSDGTISPWQEIASLPGPQNGQNHTVLVGKTLMTVGGGDNSGPLNKIYYTQVNDDGTVQPWAESVNHLPMPVGGGAVTYANGYLYVTGGFSGGYLNKVFVSKLNIEPNLNVPLLKQNDVAWGSQIYNSANLWSPGKPGIDRWGCAMTSAAMIFKYHGIDTLSNGLPLNPGTLNAWLKSQPDGYVGEGLVNWNALSRLSKISKSQNPNFSFDALENSRVNGFAEDKLKEDLEDNIPGILEVPNHFVVGKGTENGSILINDPFYERTDLSEYNDTFKSLVRFVPSNTDLSSILLVVPEGVTLSLKDENGDVVGEGYLQEPIHDDIVGGVTPKSFYMYEYKKPESGNYTIEVAATSTKQYQLKQYAYDENGEVKILTSSGIVGNGMKDSFKLIYNKETASSSEVSENVTFASFLADLDMLYAQGKIKNLGIYISMKQNTQLAEMFVGMGNKVTAKALLTTVMGQIDFQRKKHVTEDAYQILDPQVQLLLSSL